MKARAEVIAAAIVTVLAFAYLVHNMGYPLGTLAAPGAGIFPLVVGLTVMVLGAMEFWQAVGRYRSCLAGTEGEVPASDCSPTYDERRPLVLALSMVAYIGLLEPIGFLTMTAVLVVICTKLMGAPGWSRPAILAVGLCLVCYLVFEVWLHMSLPRGLLF